MTTAVSSALRERARVRRVKFLTVAACRQIDNRRETN
jgi:hypothetical protein